MSDEDIAFEDIVEEQHHRGERRRGARRGARHGGPLRSLLPLLLVLLVVEWTDLVFAIDSIPAVFAVTNDPFIVYSSNVFAILGLRSLFFVLAGAMDRFTYFQAGVSAILIFVGGKMILAKWVHLPIVVSLGVIVGVLGAAIVASWLRNRREARERLADMVPE